MNTDSLRSCFARFRITPARLVAVSQGVTVALAAALPVPVWAAQPTLPTGCSAGATCNNGAISQFATHGSASYAIHGNTGTVSQTTSKAIVNWKDFNVGAGNVVIHQFVDGAGNAPKGATFSTLNRIWQGSPSEIAGQIRTQDGQISNQIYINTNGFLFRNGAQVDMHTMTFSALNMLDDDFLHPNGVLNAYDDGRRAAFFWDGNAADFVNALIEIEPEAELKAKLGGAVMLFAPKIRNKGKIATDQGQAILAAGGKVYLTAPPSFTKFDDTNIGSPYRGLTGLLVEVDPFQEIDANNAPLGPALSGEITNDKKDPVSGKMGEIVAERGNATLVALAVNQLGRVSATTSVTHKGSIRLLAREKQTYDEVTKVPSALDAGNVVLGEDSVTEVRAYTPKENEGGQTISGDQLFHPSTVEVVGKTITLEDRAKLLVPGGHVLLSAQARGNVLQDPNLPSNDSRVYLGHDTVIDASGEKDIAVSVERYFKEIGLFGTELADNPLNRNGFLYRKKVWVDLRDLPDESFANLASYRNEIQRSVNEKLSSGGAVTVRSEGDLVQRSGSLIDVSGGTLSHSGGSGQTSSLMSSGVVTDIARASNDRVYDAILGQYTVTDEKWGVTRTIYLPANYQYYAGYVEGKDAGSIALVAPALALDGQLKGGVTVGPNQLQAPPQAGELLIGDNSKAAAADGNYFKTPAVTVLKTFDPLAGSFNSSTPLTPERADTLLLSADMLNRSGLRKMAVYSEGKITVEEGSGLALPAFSELALTGGQIAINDSIRLPSGTISLTTKRGPVVNDFAQTNIEIAPAVTLSTAGEWVNDALAGPDLAKPLVHAGQSDDGTEFTRNLRDGGTISMQSASAVVLDTGSVIDVSGSGHVDAAGKFRAGNAGTIDLATNKGQGFSELINAPLTLKGSLRAFAPGKGGTLKLAAPALTLGDTGRGVGGELLLRPDFFAANGFAKYTLAGRDSVVVSTGATIAPTVASLLVTPGHLAKATGSDIRTFSNIELKPDYERQGASITLKATNDIVTELRNGEKVGWLTVEQGATVQTEGKGAIVLEAANHQLKVQGTLVAPGGIKLSMKQATNGPGSSNDQGYDPSQAIWIGKDAVLSAAGTVINTPTSNGLRQGKVLDAGNIVIRANKGYVVAEQGAVLDVSGAAATFDLPVEGSPYIQAKSVAGNAGTIDIHAREGALLDATFKGQSSGARGGTLSLTLDRQGNTAAGKKPPYPGTASLNGVQNDLNRQWKIELTQSQDSMPAGLQAGDSIDAHAPGRIKFAADRALQGGFEQLAFNAEHAVAFQGDVALKTASGLRSITVNAPVIESDGGLVKLDAAYVNLGNLSSNATRQKPQTAQAGNGDLTVTARHVDLTGNFALSGLKKATIQSEGDIRLVGVDSNTARPTGSLTAASDVVMKARQIYASTLSAYSISAPGQLIQIARHGTPAPVLSAGSDIRFEAGTIKLEGLKAGEPGGAIKAPFGSVTLKADGITLGDGSLVSVSGEDQLVPFGRTDLTGRDYLYDLNPAVSKVIDAPPEKRIALDGRDVKFEQGATLDVSGGGDMLAYEWIKGIGGSRDVLAPDVSPNTYAVLPGLAGTVAPSDTQILAEMAEAKVSAPLAGAAVYLSGVPGLDARYYTLLPVRYGILPGARLVTLADAKYQDMLPSQAEARIGGGMIVAGHFGALNRDGGYTQTGRTQGFIVEPDTVAKARSEYLLTTASGYFKGKGAFQLPGDAGRVAFSARQSLDLIGQLVAQREAGYRGAEVDIAAPKLAVVSPGGKPLSAVEKAESYVELDADALNALGAESLLLGGTRSLRQGGDGVDVNVVSGKIIVANADAETERHALQGPEIMLAATGDVLVKQDAVIKGRGANAVHADTLHIANADGDGALLRVSGGSQVTVQRNVASGSTGNLTLEAGSTVDAAGSLNLDATKDTVLDGNIVLGAGAGLALAAGSISLGDVAGVSGGLKYDLAAFGALLKTTDDLSLRSYKTIDFHGPLDMAALLDGKATPNLRLEAQGIVGHQANGADPDVILAGNQVYLSNPTGQNIAPTAGSGTFEIQANEIRAGKGDFALSGFAQAKLTASQHIVADGVGSIVSAAPLELTARRVTATLGSQFAFKSSGDLALYAPRAGKADALPQSVPGAELAFEGDNVTIGSMIDLPGGTLSVKATGGDIILTKDGKLRAAGNEEWIFDAPVGQPGGTIDLNAANQVNLATGSVLDVSAKGADAGTLRITANSIQADGDLKGESVAGAEGATGRQGRFELDVGTLANLGPLAGKLVSGKFNDSIRLRVRNGDSALAAGNVLAARDIQIHVDAGSLAIGGTLDASGPRGGSVALATAKDVSLLGGANLIAKALNASGRGGRVEIAARDGNLDLRAGSAIDVSGGGAAPGGEVWLRAGVNVDNTIKYTALASSVTGADTHTDSNGNSHSAAFLEAVKKHDYNLANLQLNPTLINSIKSDTATFYNSLVKPVSAFRVIPGVEIRNQGGSIELTTADWNLASKTGNTYDWRYGTNKTEAGVLTLRARDDVKFSKSLTDTFIAAAGKPAKDWDYDGTDNSWAYRIVAGGDFDRASPLAVNTAGTGTVTIAAEQVVRTGTGFIDVAAGKDIRLEQTGAGATAKVGVLYTAGRKTEPLNYLPLTAGLTRQNQKYPAGGGSIRLSAQGNISGSAVELKTEPAVNQWLYRYYQSNQVNPQTSWWPRFDKFRQGVATLGGGDIQVEAKENISRLWLAAPTNAQLGGNAASPADINNLLLQGGGDIVVRAGKNISDGLVFVAKGEGNLYAGGALESQVALQDGMVRMSALRNVTVLDAFNPTMYDQSSLNSAGGLNRGARLYFNSYGEDATLRALSRAGDVVLKSNYGDKKDNTYPARLAVMAPQGSVQVDGRVVLFPNKLGDLALLARHDVKLNQSLVMSDFALASLPSILAPVGSAGARPELSSYLSPANHDPALLHLADKRIARVYAQEGDVVSLPSIETLTLAKPGTVQAGRDVENLWVRFQNVKDSDASQVLAGRDIVYKTERSNDGQVLPLSNRIEVSGPGRLEVVAGRDIDLGSSDGIVSVGNLYNPYLPDQGASIAVLAGMGVAMNGGAQQPDYAAFASQYLVVGGKALLDFDAALKLQARKEIRAALKYEAELKNRQLDDSALDQLVDNENAPDVAQRASALLAAFNAQPLPVRARRVFFNELREAGKEWTATGDAARGTAAAGLLFPETINGQPANYGGNLNLFFSQIKSERGGDIELMVPGGLVNAGLASSGGLDKDSSNLGIISSRGGDVRAYVRDDIQVNQSRIFTLGGSDIVLWSELGDIDAGKGAKTSRAAPPPVLVVKDGKVTLDYSGAVSGSGIGALETRKGVPVGDAFLIAPNGTVNAGDAGIRSAGNLLIAAQRVLGADNIQVGGAAVGVPVESAGLGGALAGVSGIGDASKATDEQTKALSNAAGDGDKAMAEARAALANFRPSFITVEVLGFGADGTSSGGPAPAGEKGKRL